jgi:predicted AAA+ superfamily ATPase
LQGYIKRKLNERILQDLEFFPVVCLIGPRQYGKSTLAHELLKELGKEYIFLDLERDSDLAKLAHTEEYLSLHTDSLVCMDEGELLRP